MPIGSDKLGMLALGELSPRPTGIVAVTETFHATTVGRRRTRGASSLTVTDTITTAANTSISLNPAPPKRYPELILEWAPTTQPTDDTPHYVDITQRLREFSWRYGRNDELAEFDPASGYIVLDNRDRAFDPTFTGGPWHGDVKPRKMFRLRFRWEGVTYPGFVGYARGFPQEWLASGYDAVVRIDLTDLLGVLAGFDLPIGFSRPAERADIRIYAVLDALGVPYPFRYVETGTTYAAALEVTSTGISGLSHARQVAGVAGEFGQLFVTRDGKVTMYNRHRRLNQAPTQVVSDDPSETLYYDDTFREASYDDTYLWNRVTVTAPDSDQPAVEATSTVSHDDYFWLSRSLSSQLASITDRQALAEYNVLLYEQPQLRVPNLPFSGARNPVDMWPVLLGLEVSDRVTFQRFYDGGEPISAEQNIEGISHGPVRNGGSWVVTLATSPADERTYWTLDDPVLGELDAANEVAP